MLKDFFSVSISKINFESCRFSQNIVTTVEKIKLSYMNLLNIANAITPRLNSTTNEHLQKYQVIELQIIFLQNDLILETVGTTWRTQNDCIFVAMLIARRCRCLWMVWFFGKRRCWWWCWKCWCAGSFDFLHGYGIGQFWWWCPTYQSCISWRWRC